MRAAERGHATRVGASAPGLCYTAVPRNFGGHAAYVLRPLCDSCGIKRPNIIVSVAEFARRTRSDGNEHLSLNDPRQLKDF